MNIIKAIMIHYTNLELSYNLTDVQCKLVSWIDSCINEEEEGEQEGRGW